MAQESHQSIGELLTEASRGFVRRWRVRPEVLKHVDVSMAENEELGASLLSDPVQFLTLDKSLEIHHRVIEIFAGTDGVRDRPYAWPLR
jgi:hypothetical protein